MNFRELYHKNLSIFWGAKNCFASWYEICISFKNVQFSSFMFCLIFCLIQKMLFLSFKKSKTLKFAKLKSEKCDFASKLVQFSPCVLDFLSFFYKKYTCVYIWKFDGRIEGGGPGICYLKEICFQKNIKKSRLIKLNFGILRNHVFHISVV